MMKKTRFKIENMEPDFIERLLDDKDEVYGITDFIKRLALKEFFERHNLIELENLTKHNNNFKKVCQYCKRKMPQEEFNIHVCNKKVEAEGLGKPFQ